MDRICLYAQDNEKIAQILRDNEKTICSEVLADEIVYDDLSGASYTKQWNINAEEVTLGVKKVD